MISRAVLFASCLAVGCAQSLPGVDPPGDEVYFPLGMAVIPDASGQPAHLAVVSSNFDQRFNSGTINTYAIDQLFAIATCDPAAETEPCFHDSGSVSLRAVQSDTVRIFSFGGDLIYAPISATEGNLYVAARGRNRLSMIHVNTAEGKLLSCSTAGQEEVIGSDCTRAYVIDSRFADPLSLARAPASSVRPELIAVGHVSTNEQNNTIIGAASLANVSIFRSRVEQEKTVGEGGGFPDPIALSPLGSFGGISGLAFAGDIFGLSDVFLATTLHSAPDVLMATFTPTPIQDGTGRFQLELRDSVVPVLLLNNEARATEMRSLALDVEGAATRAYVSLRFLAPDNSFNAGIGVIDLTGPQPMMLAVLEVGEELQRPFIWVHPVSGRRFLYVGDIRRDKVYILDVTTDQPLLVKEIDGRATRTIDGEPVQANVLDGPSNIVFVTRGMQTLAFVSNFTNSTLAVLDVSDPDPRLHRVISRLGRNIDPEGETEEP